jgi:hypothetical protein
MAKKMYEMFESSGNLTTSWDPESMHIQCFCHKLALIVNAGLQALALKTLPPGKTKRLVLGFFPVLGKLAELPEEDENHEVGSDVQEITVASQPEESPDEIEDEQESDYGNADDEESCEETESDDDPDAEPRKGQKSGEGQPAKDKHARSAKLLDLTVQVCYNSLNPFCLLFWSKFDLYLLA